MQIGETIFVGNGLENRSRCLLTGFPLQFLGKDEVGNLWIQHVTRHYEPFLLKLITGASV